MCVTNFDLYDSLNTPYSVYNKTMDMPGSKGHRYEEKFVGYSNFHRHIETIIERVRQENEEQVPKVLEEWVRVSFPELSDTITVEQLQEINLKNLWIMRHCESMPYASYQEYLATLPELGVTKTHFEADMHNELTDLYQKIMGIAVRTGDKWAIRSIEPPEDWDEDDDVDEISDFFNFIAQIDPLLYHRYMSTKSYGSESQERRLEHALRAFELTRNEYGQDIQVRWTDTREILVPAKRLSHYIKLNRFTFSSRYTEDYLDALGGIAESENP